MDSLTELARNVAIVEAGLRAHRLKAMLKLGQTQPVKSSRLFEKLELEVQKKYRSTNAIDFLLEELEALYY